jgi:transposase-like protein
MVKVGAKYSVSDNAIRKWLRWYEADIAKQVGEALAVGKPREIRI